MIRADGCPIGHLDTVVSVWRTPLLTPTRSRSSTSTATSSCEDAVPAGRPRRARDLHEHDRRRPAEVPVVRLGVERERGARAAHRFASSRPARSSPGPRSSTPRSASGPSSYGRRLLGKDVEFWYSQFLAKPPATQRADVLAPRRGLLGPQPRRQGHHVLVPAAGRRRDQRLHALHRRWPQGRRARAHRRRRPEERPADLRARGRPSAHGGVCRSSVAP